MNDFFKRHCERILIYFAKESVTDPYRKTREYEIISSTPISAIVSDLISTQMQWKMPGIDANKGKEIIFHKRYLETIKSCYKIKIKSDYYEGWRVNGQLQYREIDDYIRAYIYIKKG